MSICCNDPTVRLKKIKANREPVKKSDSQKSEFNNRNVLPREDMTPVVYPVAPEPDDIQISPEETVPTPGIFEEPLFFQVPPNPLLPPDYREVLDYNNLQYSNGFYRTQIGRFVKVEQLVSSTNTVVRYGFLIGVGINYILLQDPDSNNIGILDTYNIKYMEVYYRPNTEVPLPGIAGTSNNTKPSNGSSASNSKGVPDPKREVSKSKDEYRK